MKDEATRTHDGYKTEHQKGAKHRCDAVSFHAWNNRCYIYSLSNARERKSLEKKKLYSAFVDLEKAFDHLRRKVVR